MQPSLSSQLNEQRQVFMEIMHKGRALDVKCMSQDQIRNIKQSIVTNIAQLDGSLKDSVEI